MSLIRMHNLLSILGVLLFVVGSLIGCSCADDDDDSGGSDEPEGDDDDDDNDDDNDDNDTVPAWASLLHHPRRISRRRWISLWTWFG